MVLGSTGTSRGLLRFVEGVVVVAYLTLYCKYLGKSTQGDKIELNSFYVACGTASACNR